MAKNERIKESEESAGKTQIPEDYYKVLAMIESSGRPSIKAKTSSASGLFQFVNKTWKAEVKELGKNYSLADRNDPIKAEEVVRHFTKKNQKILEKSLGRPVTSMRELYLAHFLGAGGGTKFIKAAEKNPSAIAKDFFPAAAKSNESIFYKPDLTPRTLAEVSSYFDKKVDEQAARVSAGKVPDVVKNIGKPKDVGDFSDTEMDNNRFADTSQGSAKFTERKAPKGEERVEEDFTTDKEKLAQQSLIDREEDLGFTEDRIKAPMSRASEPGLEEKKKPAAKSPSGPYSDYSGRPFDEAFADARSAGQDFFYYNGKLKHTMTAEELMGDSVAVAPKEEAKKEEGVGKYLDKAPEPLGWYEPAPGDMLGGERFSMIPRYPVPDVMDKEEDKPKSKVSDILQKTSDENYDKMTFRKAFKKARDKGEDQFDWRGKPYTTAVKGE